MSKSHASTLRQLRHRHLPAALFALATIALIIAALLPGQQPPSNQIILLVDRSGSVGEEPFPAARLDPLLAEADSVLRFDFAERADRSSKAHVPATGSEDVSDYSAALRLAGAVPRSGPTRRRIVLFGDGRWTTPAPEDVATALADELVLDAVPLGTESSPDAAVLDAAVVEPPDAEGTATLRVRLRLIAAQAAADAVLRAATTNQVLVEKPLNLRAPVQSVDLRVGPLAPGLHRLLLQVRLPGDRRPENDSAGLVLQVQPPAEVLWIGRAPPPLEVPVRILADWPDEKDLQRSGCIVVDTASGPPPEAAARLPALVREGRSLLWIGGGSLPGYDDQLTKLLPLDLEPRDGLALAVALDTSGSMGERPGNSEQSKLQIAGAAVLETWRRLGSGDRWSLSAFTDSAETLQPLVPREQSAQQQEALRRELADLQPSGGTSLFAGITAAADSLRGSRASVRLVLLLTDGATMESNQELDQALAQLRQTLRKDPVAIVVVALGDEPDRQALQRLETDLGAEVLYASDRLLALPEILSAEVRRRRERWATDGRVDRLVESPLTRALPDNLPPLKRFARAGALRNMDDAQALLETAQGQVLLAVRRVGMGRSIWLAGRPDLDWTWGPAGADLLREIANACASRTDRGTVQADEALGSLRIQYQADARTDAGDAQGRLEARLTPLDQEAEGRTAWLLPAEPGLWRGEQQRVRPGLWRIDVLEPASADLLATQPVLIEDRREWLSPGVDGQALQRLAQAGGGRLVLGADDWTPWEDVPVSGPDAGSQIPQTLALLGVALLLLGLLAAALR